MAEQSILEIRHLNSWYGRGKSRIQVLRDVSLTVEQGEIMGIVGESGCGKSTLSKYILGMVDETEGELILRAERPQMVFQDPYGSLNPVKTVGWILQEPLRAIGIRGGEERRRRVLEMMEQVGLDQEHYHRRPGQLSGGQRQRVAIAGALIQGCKFVVLDEPVSALDVTLQAQILRLLEDLRKKLDLTYLFVSHDLAVVNRFCHRVAVLYGGCIVEEGPVDRVYGDPQHEYTKKLLAASVALD